MSYKKNLIQYLKACFDIEEHPVFHDPFSFEFQAVCKQIHQSYVLSKEWVYEQCNTNEYILFMKIQDFPDFQDLKNCLKQNHQKIISVDGSHMSSVITLVLEIDFPLPPDTVRGIEKFHFYKSFLLGFKGWVNTRLIVINTRNKTGYANRFGKKELPGYLHIA